MKKLILMGLAATLGASVLTGCQVMTDEERFHRRGMPSPAEMEQQRIDLLNHQEESRCRKYGCPSGRAYY